MSTITKIISAKATIINENEAIDYKTLVQKNSKNLREIKDVYDIFISHASDSRDAYNEEKNFVITLDQILKKNYGKKVYLDLALNDSYQTHPIINAAILSKYGIFICSYRYIMITLGRRSETFVNEFDTIPQEIEIFRGKERYFGLRIIPVKFGLDDDVYKLKNPFGPRFYISIEDEMNKSYIERASFVANKIIEKINKLESHNKI